MEFGMLRGQNWVYFQVGKYWVDETWFEIRVGLDFFTKRIHFSCWKIFQEGKKEMN